ncbi:MAG: hypothetical protein PSV35_02805 [bacterium]|nr:hypothetical protein [bacterium]
MSDDMWFIKKTTRTINQTDHLNNQHHLPFAMQVVNNSSIKIANSLNDEGILIGSNAVAAAGAQSEFIAANMIQAHALKCCLILRAGDLSQANKTRCAKSGMNLTKTSNQGLFKGAIAEEQRFGRIENDGMPTPQNYKDEVHLKLDPAAPSYQHTMQLDINMLDILKVTKPGGDMEILGFNQLDGILRLGYKHNCGPRKDVPSPIGFNGQFIINLYEGVQKPQFYSIARDKPENQPDWNAVKRVIAKPAILEVIPDKIYEHYFNHSFVLNYTEKKTANPQPNEIRKAKVFANRPRNATEFIKRMSKQNELTKHLSQCPSLAKIVQKLKENLQTEKTKELMLQIYDEGGSIIASDWDGMALGHNPALEERFTEELNTQEPGSEGLNQQEILLTRANLYLKQMRHKAQKKQEKKQNLYAFEQQILSFNSITEIISDFALARAGIITSHEFVFQHVLNHAYADPGNTFYGEKYPFQIVQRIFDQLLISEEHLSTNELHFVASQLLKTELITHDKYCSKAILNQLAQHITDHLNLAQKYHKLNYILPHLDHDINIHDLYQHGFDMRNRQGCNIKGAWLLISDDGGLFYGKKQEQLIEVLLTGNLLEKNHLDINPRAEMAVGWHRVISRQIALKQKIPEKTLKQSQEFKKSHHLLPDKHSTFKKTSPNTTTKIARPQYLLENVQTFFGFGFAKKWNNKLSRLEQIIKDFKQIANLYKSDIEKISDMQNFNATFVLMLKLKEIIKNKKDYVSMFKVIQSLTELLAEIEDEIPDMIAGEDQKIALVLLKAIKKNLALIVSNVKECSSEDKSAFLNNPSKRTI